MRNQSVVNYYIDIGLAITFLITAVTGVFKMPFFFKYGLINYSKYPMLTINFLHDWVGMLMTALVLVHLVLHWRWIVTMTKKIFGKKRI